MGCKRIFDRKGPLRVHEGKCLQYKSETRSRRTNFTRMAEEKVAGPSGVAQVLPEPEIVPEREPQRVYPEEAAQEVFLFTTLLMFLTEKLDQIEPPLPEYRASGLPRRKTRLPKRYRDILPAPPPVVDNPSVVEPNVEPIAPENPMILDEPSNVYTTAPNSYGIYRVFKYGAPSFNPDDDFSINHVADNPNFAPQPPSVDQATSFSPFAHSSETIEHPFANQTTLRLMSWFYNGTNTKSLNDLNNLVHNVLLASDFKPEDLAKFDAAKSAKQLDNFQKPSTSSADSSTLLKDGWIRSSISIKLPCDGFCQTEEAAPTYQLNGLLYRKPIEVIKAAYQEGQASQFHLSPFEEYWKPSQDAPPERIFSELYNCDAYLKENDRVQTHAQQSDCSLEAVIAPMMIWSDATHLTNFGSSSLWPIYFYPGNLSKYTRAKPSAFAAHHLAYIPKVG
jgi:hypothetical protein